MTSVCAACRYFCLSMSMMLFVILYMIVSLCACLCFSSWSIFICFFNLGCGARSSGVVVCDEPGSSSIDLLELVPILFCVGVPYSCTVLQCWSN